MVNTRVSPLAITKKKRKKSEHTDTISYQITKRRWDKKQGTMNLEITRKQVTSWQ